MKVCLLFNPKSGSADKIDDIRRLLGRKHRLTAVETRDAADLASKAAEAAAGKFDAVAVAGGDGTLHAVVNGLGPNFPHATLAILPLGTGNDLCRTLAVPLDPAAAVKLIRHGRKRAIDVARVEGVAANFMVNAATGGFSGRVAADVTPELKQSWGPLAYLRGAAGPIAERQTFRVTLRIDGGPPEVTDDVLNLVVANGRTAAGGVLVAPTANPEDGRLDLVVVRAGGILDLSVVAASLMAGDYLSHDNVTHRHVSRVEVESDPPMPFSIDGELVETDRIAFEVVPKALRVFPGKDYRPDPRGKPVGGGIKSLAFGAMAGTLHLLARSLRWPGLGVTFAVGALLLVSWLTRGVIAGDFGTLNHDVGRAVHGWATPGRTAAVAAVSRLGDPFIAAALSGVVALLFVSWRWYSDAGGVFLTLFAVAATELLLKPWLAVPRPDWFEPLHPALGYGYPSGHALRAFGLCGYLALVLVAGRPWAARRWLAAAGLMAVAFAVCGTRVYLIVHSLTDVTAGALIGAAWAGLCAAVAHNYRPGTDVPPASSNGPSP